MHDAVFRHILVPTDGSEPSVRAARLAIRLAKAGSRRISVLFVIDEVVLGELQRFNGTSEIEAKVELEDHGRRYLELIAREADREGVTARTMIRQGTPFEEIVSTASEVGADLIVMGHVGQRGPKRILLGSVTSHVLDFARCPVLVVKDRT